MVDFQSLVIVAGLSILIVTAAGVLILGWRDSLRRAAAPAHMQNDLTNMMILFQTMRDILTQQKDLAREFNVSIDKKVGEVRDLIQSTGDVREDLDRAKREIAILSTQTRKELLELEQRLSDVDGKIVETRGPLLDAVEEIADPDVVEVLDSLAEETDASEVGDVPLDVGDALPEAQQPLKVIPPEIAEDVDSFVERWAGADFRSDEDIALEEVEVELSAVEVAQSRDAFRDLLNLHTESVPARDAPSSTEVLKSGENGGGYLTPIQRRVYEYSDAGMRVPEIARALGVGKGEVRLILSLRRDRDR